jgi:hypothetical protein
MNISVDSSTIWCGLIFGGIGLAAFVYGKKQGDWIRLILGLALMAYPLLVTQALWQWVTGAVLTILLFVWRQP